MNHEPVLPQIDWDAWDRFPWHRNGSGRDDKEHPSFWDRKASQFARKAHFGRHRQEAERLLDRFRWSPDERVLDVGAGPGTFAIPLARRVAHVTAVDISGAMLASLRDQAGREEVTNLTLREGRWLDLSLETLGTHQTVICFNALGVVAISADGSCHMVRALERLGQAGTKRGMILVPHAGLPMDPPMRAALQIPETSCRRERIAVLYHLMVHAGFLPNLEILSRPFFWTFDSLEEGVEVLADRLGLAEDPGRRGLLASHLASRLIPDGNQFILAYPVPQALYWWDKDEL